jgi:hypothetical protein
MMNSKATFSPTLPKQHHKKWLLIKKSIRLKTFA